MNNAKIIDLDNAKLEQAIQDYAKAGDSDGECLRRLVEALRDVELLVPAMQSPKKDGFQPYVVKNSAGVMFMPAFTSMKKITNGQNYVGMLRLPYKQCVSMILDYPSSVQGITLNPVSDGLVLKKQLLELSRKLEQGEPPAAVTVKIEDFHMMMRHNAEFQHIPQKLYEKKQEFIRELSKETLCALYKEPYVKAEQEKAFPYTEDDFDFMELDIRDDLNLVQITVPAGKIYRTNCRELYIVWNPQTERIRYYAIEKGEDEKGAKYLVSVVREDGRRERLEDAPAEGNEIGRIMELFGGGEST